MPSGTINCDLDGYMISSSPTTNFGTGTTAISGGLTTIRIGFMQFSIAAYLARIVSQALLRRECTAGAASAPPCVISAMDLIPGAVVEDEVTYNKRNTSTSWSNVGGDDDTSFLTTGSYNMPTAPGVFDVDITTLFNEALDLGFSNLCIRDRQESGTSRTYTWATREHATAQKPIILVTYSEASVKRFIAGPYERERILTF